MLVILFDLDDKLTRVQPLIDHVRRVSQDIFQPYEKIAVDERPMVRSKHNFSDIRQFMKDKPVKFGIKLWALADTITGYTSIFLSIWGKKELRLLIFQKIFYHMLLFSIYFLDFLIRDKKQSVQWIVFIQQTIWLMIYLKSRFM